MHFVFVNASTCPQNGNSMTKGFHYLNFLYLIKLLLSFDTASNHRVHEKRILYYLPYTYEPLRPFLLMFFRFVALKRIKYYRIYFYECIQKQFILSFKVLLNLSFANKQQPINRYVDL